MNKCPDDGVCHHVCRFGCTRVVTCGPLSSSGWDGWPKHIDDRPVSHGEAKQRNSPGSGTRYTPDS